MSCLLVLQEELSEIGAYLSEQYHCEDLKKYIRAIWFDFLATLTREKIPLLSVFTTERLRFPEVSKLRESSSGAMLQRLEDSVLREIESSNNNRPQIDYESIFGEKASDGTRLKNQISTDDNTGAKRDQERTYFFRSRRHFKSKAI